MTGPGRRLRIIDGYLPKIEECVERGNGKVRADVIHSRLVGPGFTGTERTHAAGGCSGQGRVASRAPAHVPAVDHRAGAVVAVRLGRGSQGAGLGRQSAADVAVLRLVGCSRFRVAIPVWDPSLPTLVACLDATLRRLGGVSTYVLTDNPRTVSVDHVAGVPVHHPQIVEVGRHYGMGVDTCVPYHPESKGGTEATVKIAKADLVPTEANLRGAYASFAELEAACEEFCANVNTRQHRESARVPADALVGERTRLHACRPRHTRWRWARPGA